MESRILTALIQSREAYDSVAEYIDIHNLSPVGATLFRFISEYYANDHAASSCDVDILRGVADTNIADGANKDQMFDTLDELENTEVSISNVVKQVLDKQRVDLGQELAQAILTQQPAHAIEDIVERYQAVLHKQTLDVDIEEEYCGPCIGDLVKTHYDSANLIPIAPKSLNRRLGNGVALGSHIVISSRPEAGKTAVAVNMICAAAFQGFKCLYYANEEPVVNIILRCVANFSGMTINEIREQPEKAQELANKRGFDNIIFVYASRNSPWELKALCKKYEPKLVIVDQLRNLNMNVEGLTELLERGAKAMRDIAAQQHCVIVSITQSGESAEGKAILRMSDIDSSKTGLQGACDAIILMGASPELVSTGRRCFNLVKNKTTGNHDSFYVNINEQLSRITD